MPLEIERKFLIKRHLLDLPGEGTAIRQGYLPMAGTTRTVARIRIAGSEAYLTIKGENRGAVRAEYEYMIPVVDAQQMLDTLCETPLIEKTRYRIDVGQHTWEIDIFHGDNAGLEVAEIELTGEDESFDKPGWLGLEVTDDARYYNSNLRQRPYASW